MLCFVIFIKILEYRYIANFASEDRRAYLLCQQDVSRVCDVYEEERSWSGVNRTVLKIYAALSVRTDLSTVIHREKDQRKKKKEALLYYVISSKSIR